MMLPFDEQEFYDRQHDHFYDPPWVMDPHDWDQNPDRNECESEKTYESAMEMFSVVLGDRDRLLQNIARLTGVDVEMLPPSGVAMDEFLDAWFEKIRRMW